MLAQHALFWAARWAGPGVSAGSGTRSCFTHFGVKNVTLLGLGGFPSLLTPSCFPTQLLMRQFAGARQMQTGCPGPGAGSGHAGQRGTFGGSMWRVGVPKAWLVASICFSKSLSGSFTHVSACMCLKREGKHILCLPGAWSPALGMVGWGSWGHLLGHPTLQEHRALEKVPARHSQTLKPPSSASTMNTTLAFQQCQCQNLAGCVPCPAFPNTQLLFRVKGRQSW